jgi:hypothetical protein
MAWATFWAIFSQTHLVTLHRPCYAFELNTRNLRTLTTETNSSTLKLPKLDRS